MALKMTFDKMINLLCKAQLYRKARNNDKKKKYLEKKWHDELSTDDFNLVMELSEKWDEITDERQQIRLGYDKVADLMNKLRDSNSIFLKEP